MRKVLLWSGFVIGGITVFAAALKLLTRPLKLHAEIDPQDIFNDLDSRMDDFRPVEAREIRKLERKLR